MLLPSPDLPIIPIILPALIFKFILSSIFGYSLNYINDTEKINKLLIDFKQKSYY